MASFLQRIIKEKSTKAPLHESSVKASSCCGAVVKPARLAIYDSPTSIPRVIDLSPEECSEFVTRLATKTYQLSQEKGGNIPFSVIKEIVENLVHAYFKEVIVSILDNGNTIRVSDQGPGILDKEKALQPGFSTATTEMKCLIKGVGSGLPVAKEVLSFLGGVISIDNNINQGTVVTLALPPNDKPATTQEPTALDIQDDRSYSFPLTNRQKKALSLITELGAAGPSVIASELDISLSTAHRDLTYLEECDLIKSDELGKRSLTSQGVKYLNIIFNS